MKLKKSFVILAIAIICITAIGVGSTLALLTSLSGVVKNTFTVGKVNITLSETTGNSYQLIPGTTVDKDPKITVLKDSEECWLFVRIEAPAEADSFISYHAAEGWAPLTGQPGIYYRKAPKTAADTAYSVLLNDCFTVKDTVSKAQLSALSSPLTLTFTAYAIQAHGIESASVAWSELQSSIR